MWNQIWSQNPIEVLKLLSSIATPVTIAFIGFVINRSIQRQNAIAQRQSSWLTKWADDLLKTATGFNDSATSFMLLYAASEWKVRSNLPGSVEEQKSLHLDVVPVALAMLKERWEISKYIGFAPVCGKGLEDATHALFDEANNWMRNTGGNMDAFRQKQLVFNTNARNVHAELLGLKESKD